MTETNSAGQLANESGIGKPSTTKITKRTPRSAGSIEAGALSLPLKDRISLAKKIAASITAEVQDLEAKAKEAREAAGV